MMNRVGLRKHSATSSHDSRSGSGLSVRPSAKAMLNGYDPTQVPSEVKVSPAPVLVSIV